MFTFLKALFKADIKNEISAPTRDGFVAIRLIRHMSANGVSSITRLGDGGLELVVDGFAHGLVADFDNSFLDAPALGKVSMRNLVDQLLPAAGMSISLKEGIMDADGSLIHEFHREISLDRVWLEWTTTTWSHYGYIDITEYMKNLSGDEARDFLANPDLSLLEAGDRWMKKARETHEKFSAPFNFHGMVMGKDLWLARHKEIEG